MNFKLELTENEINVILQSLAKQSYEVVANLIPKIQQQATEQIQDLKDKGN